MLLNTAERSSPAAAAPCAAAALRLFACCCSRPPCGGGAHCSLLHLPHCSAPVTKTTQIVFCRNSCSTPASKVFILEFFNALVFGKVGCEGGKFGGRSIFANNLLPGFSQAAKWEAASTSLLQSCNSNQCRKLLRHSFSFDKEVDFPSYMWGLV